MAVSKYKALLLDFYGTLVEEDDVIVADLLDEIAKSSPISPDQRQMGRDWITRFRALCNASYGENFKTQRVIEYESLAVVLERYQAAVDCQTCCDKLFAHWRAPQVFNDARLFVEQNGLPICIVSNIDRADLEAAIGAAGWQFDYIVTSEDCRSYKPRPEMFEIALEVLNCRADEVLHVGDSLSSDVFGGQQMGIDTAWINRKNKPLPDDTARPTYNAVNLQELLLELVNL